MSSDSFDLENKFVLYNSIYNLYREHIVHTSTDEIIQDTTCNLVSLLLQSRLKDSIKLKA